jgi:opacity protein-like surface antigen
MDLSKMKKRIPLAVSLILFISFSIKAQVTVDFETGLVNTGYNDVRIPGNQGTFISLKDDLKPDSDIFYRIKLNYTFGSSHTLSLLYAPLTIQSEGRLNKDVNFTGKLFTANKDLSGSYKFNSYRLTYRYDFVKNPDLEFGLGVTAKIRDARIALSSQNISAEKTNVGFVPIINFRLFWHISNELGLLFEGDGFAAKQGRAFDVLLSASYNLSDKIGLKAGYRILEGGADNDEVYNFALLHYVSLGVSYKL